MSLDAIFGIAGSGLNAQSLRLNTTASNMANAQSAASSTDEVYRARHPVFTTALNQARGGLMPLSMTEESGAGVQVLGIVESDAPLQQRYEPSHPLANADGYVFYPNVNVVEEMTNMISASRSFQTNVEVLNAAKQMMQRVLTMGQ
ncbi:flagellar basal body rod protein FlgC [Simiduia aestuariiviva]|uniref:Flagellar basal-body rod protein FlgC n=1 Tax=Simiduia aestuariiviva TaxID=1510459 RepID=A0A839UPN4_9GAMM|nr:flagellar basal body rod protein FlgC [Simiduia aestuariiviva]MBB3168449.1 flagellar basal-body rod protein FlgC [Simiduia aestuariiviva]